MSARNVDLDKFRLRSFVAKLVAIGEMEVHEQPVALADLSAVIGSPPKAKYFRRVGAEQYEMVAAVAGSRRRLAEAFGTDERNVIHEYMRRMNDPQPVVEVPSSDAPVHQVVLRGDAIDLSKLPFHLRREAGWRAIHLLGHRLHGRSGDRPHQCGLPPPDVPRPAPMRANLPHATDLKKSYIACVERRETLPASFAIGSHPLDYLAAGLRLPGDEFGLVATLRGEPVPMVRGLTNGVPAPADAEMIIEGYFDELGYREREGPYGKFYGFYRPVHMDRCFTYRHHRWSLRTFCMDGLSQRRPSKPNQNPGNLGGLNSRAAGLEVRCGRPQSSRRRWAGGAGIEADASTSASRCGPRGQPGQARHAISALATPFTRVKHVFVVDDDVDVFSDEQMEWAMSTRFRAASNIVIASGHPAFYMDPSADENGMVERAGFDLTARYGVPDTIDDPATAASHFNGQRRCDSAREALRVRADVFLSGHGSARRRGRPRGRARAQRPAGARPADAAAQR